MSADERKKLPALIVTPDGYTLISRFAADNGISRSEAIRQLLQESPRLQEYARRQGHDINALNVSPWGGARGED